MNLEELQKKATAAELCLIDQIVKLVRADEQKKAISRTLEFVGKSLPPSIEDKRFDRESGPRWFKEFQAFVRNEQKTQD